MATLRRPIFKVYFLFTYFFPFILSSIALIRRCTADMPFVDSSSSRAFASAVLRVES